MSHELDAGLLRTLAQAVESLTELVMRLPSQVDQKIEEMQNRFTQTVVQLRAEMEEVHVEAGTIRGEFNTMAGSLRLQMGETVEATTSVIADNRSAVKVHVQQITDRFTDVEKQAKDFAASVTATSEQLHGNIAEVSTQVDQLRKTCAEEIASLRNHVGEVRQACDLTDLNHGIAKLEGRTKGIEDTVLGLIEVDVTLGERFERNDVILQAHSERIDSIKPFDSSGLEQVTSRLAERADEAQRAVAEVDRKVEVLVQGHVAVTERIEGQDTRLQAVVEQVGEIKPFDSSKIERDFSLLTERTGDLSTSVSTVIRTVAEQQGEQEQLIATTAAQAKQLQELAAQVGDIRPFDPADINLGIATLAERADKTEHGADQLALALGAVIETATTFAESTDSRLQVLTERVAEIKPFDPSSINRDVSTLNERAGEIEQAVHDILHKVQEVTVGHNNTCERVESQDTRLQALTELVAEIKPFDATELRDGIAQVREVLERQETVATKLAQRVDNHGEELVSQAKSLGDAMAEVRKTIVDQGDVLDERINVYIRGLTERVGKLDDEITVNDKKTDEQIGSVRALIETGGAATEKAVSSIYERIEGLGQQLSTLRVGSEAMNFQVRHLEEVSASYATQKQVEESARAFAASLAQFGDQFNQTIANMNASLRSAFDGSVKSLAQTDEDIKKSIAELPGPFDPTELRIELLNKVAEMLPEPNLDVKFEDQDLTVTLTVGNKTVDRTITIDSGIEYKGVYNRDEEYRAGNLVTYKGSMWYAKGRPTAEPGKDLEGWQLAVKCGRDGKDAVPRSIKPVRDSETGLVREFRTEYDSGDEDDPHNRS